MKKKGLGSPPGGEGKKEEGKEGDLVIAIIFWNPEERKLYKKENKIRTEQAREEKNGKEGGK